MADDIPNDLIPAEQVPQDNIPNDLVPAEGISSSAVAAPIAPVSSAIPNDLVPATQTSQTIPAPTFDQRRVQNVDDTNPEKQAYFSPEDVAAQNSAYADMYAAGQNKGIDSQQAAEAIKAKYPFLQNANPTDIKWYIEHYRAGGKTFPDFVGSGDKGLVVSKKQEPVSAAQSIAAPVADFYQGVGEGFNSLEGSLDKGLVRGIAQLQGGDAPDKAEKLISDMEDAANNGYQNPTGWGRFGGNLVGGAAVYAPAMEVAPFAEMGPIGHLVDTTVQGGLIGAAGSGGKDIAQNTVEGAATGAELHGLLSGLAGGVGLVHANIPDALASHFSDNGTFGGMKRLVFGTDNPKVTAQTFEPEFTTPQAPYAANRTEHLANVKAAVDDVTKGWDNSPDFNIVGSTRNLTNAQRAEIRAGGAKSGDVQAWVGKDGKVNVIANNIDDPSQIPSILYHEVSGHIGLNKQFGDGLDDLLQRVYDTNWRARQYADNYTEQNPKVYQNDPSGAHIRAAEEYLASQQEQGPQTLNNWEKVKQYVRDFGRNRLGMDLRYNDNDVKNILQQAHAAATGDSGRVQLDGGRFMYTGSKGAENVGAEEGSIDPNYSKVSPSVKPSEDNTHVDVLRDDDYTGTYHPINIRDPRTGEVVSAGRAYVDPETGEYQGSTLMHPLTKEIHPVTPDISDLIQSKLPKEKGLGTEDVFSRYDGKPGEIPVTTYTDEEAQALINQRLGENPRFSLRRNGTESLTRTGQDIARAVRDENKTTQTWEETERKAANLGLTPGKLFKKKVFDAKPETAVAISNVVDDLVNKSSAIEERVARGEGTARDIQMQASALARAVHALEILLGHKTDIGRSSNILRALKDVPYDQLKDIDVGRLSDPQYVQDVTFKLNQYKNNPLARAQILKGISKGLPEDVITGMHYDMMLSGLHTQSRNIFGQTSNLLADMLAAKPAGMILGHTSNVLKDLTGVGSKSDVMSMKEYGARWFGIMRSLSDLGTWKQTAQSFQEMRPLSKTDQQYSTQTKNPIPYTDYGRRTLAAVDNLMHSLMVNSDYYGAAVRDAEKSGKTGPAFWDHVDMKVKNPTDAMTKAANTYASDLSLIGKSDGVLAQAINSITRAPSEEEYLRRATRFLVMNTVPWLRVPANAVRTMFESNLLTTGLSRNTRAAFGSEGSSIARQTAIAKATIGTALAGYFSYQYLQGNLRRNPQTYNLEYKSGNQWHSMNGMDALNVIVGPTMAMTDAVKAARDKDAAQAWAGVINGFSGTVMSEGFGTQLSDLMEALNPRGAGALNRLATRQLQSWEPALGRDVARQMDPIVRDSNVEVTGTDKLGRPVQERDWTKTLGNKLLENIPGQSQKLPAKLDINGQPVTRPTSLTGLFDTSPVDNDPVNKEIARLSEKTGKTIVNPARLLSTQGQEDAGKRAHDIVSQMISSPVWDKIPDSKKIQLIDRQYSHARAAYRRVDKANAKSNIPSDLIPSDLIPAN